jgi:peptidyl-prolyl cis-trans isomerase D
MSSFFRRVSKSKIGTGIMAAVLIAILAGFALADLSNFGSGNIGFGMSSSTLAEVGGEKVTEQEMSSAMQRRLQQVRQQRPDADYSTIIGDLDKLIEEALTNKTLVAFSEKFRFPLSKRLVDAEIAQIPQTKGFDGKFSETAYQQFLSQQRLTDAEVRDVLRAGLLQRYLLTPVATNARASVGMATPYASMMLETREGEAGAIPLTPFKAAFKPTDADLQQYYSANRNRYMVPEQRVIRVARIGPEQVASITANEQDIASYYNQHRADYAAKESRDISQVVVQDQATANGIAARAKDGATMAAASAPAGTNAAVTSLKDQSRAGYASVAGDKAAAAMFAAPAGAVVGPIQTDFGWAVAKVDAIHSQPGKSLDQARAEIAAKVTEDKRKNAVEDLVDKVQQAIDDGSNFVEAAAAAKLTVTSTPLITANGTSRSDANFKLPPELAPVLKSGFDLETNDPPEIVTLPNDKGNAMVSPGQIVPAAPAPLQQVREQVANDWINNKATERARAVASQIKAKIDHGVPLAQAMKESGVALPPVQPIAARRIQIAMAQGPVPRALKLLFTIGQGKSELAPDAQGRGFFIVRVNKVTPGNALMQPALIGRLQNDLQDGLSQDYAQEFLAAMRKELGSKRNESAIQAFKKRMVSSGG